jgi:hypothetical protein
MLFLEFRVSSNNIERETVSWAKFLFAIYAISQPVLEANLTALETLAHYYFFLQTSSKDYSVYSTD